MSQDYIALEWVKGEIRETLQQAQQSLEAYVEHPDDRSRLRFCLSYLHQVHGTLQMVEFYGAALLAEEMEAVALALAESQLSNEQDGLEVLMQAIIQLPHYLEHVKVGRRDLPVVLLPILNELRSTRGENFLSETSLFTPHIEHNTPLTGEQKNQFTQVNFSQWLRKTRQMLQAATLQLLQDREPDLAKHYLNKLFARLNKAMGGTPQGVVWLPALAFSEWLMKQESLPKSAKVLLRQLDQLLKQDLDQGIAVINRPPADELLKNLLFYVARTDVRGDAIRMVQRRFRLDEALPSAEDMATEQDSMGGPGVEAVTGALSALIEEISAVKDGLDQLMRGSQERAPALESARKTIRQIGDTMGMLGLGMPRKVMQEQESQLVGMLDNGETDDSVLLDVAGALLYVEATLNGMLRDGDLSRNASDSAMSDAQRAVLREARNVLEQVKDSVVAYIAHQWSTEKLEDVPGLLHSIEGSLNMVPLPRVANLLADLSSFIRQALLSDRPKPEFGVMDMVAEVLSGIEYYLERFSEGGESTDEELLDRAAETLSNLLQICNVTSDGDLDESGAAVDDSMADDDVAITSFNEALGLDDAAEVSVGEDTGASEEETDTEVEAEEDLIDDEIIEVFLEEADEVLDTLREYWPQYVNHRDDQDALTTVRRAFHTLKGSGRMVRAADIGELAWSVENLFNRILDHTVSVHDTTVEFVDQVIGVLPQLISDFRDKAPASLDVQPLMDKAFALAEGRELEPAAMTEAESETSEEEVLEVGEDAPEVEVQADEIELTDDSAPLLLSEDDNAVGTIETAAEHEDDYQSLMDVLDGAESTEAASFEALLASLPDGNSDGILDNASESAEEASDNTSDETDDLPLPEIDEDLSEEDADRLSLLEVFIPEAEMHLTAVSDFVAQSRDESFTNPVTDDLQRALHTLKGSAHMAEVTPLAELAAAQEHLVKEIRGYQLPNSPALTDVLHDAAELIRGQLTLDALRSLEMIPGADDVIQRISDIEQNQLAHLSDTESAGPSPDVLARFLSSGMDSLIRADELLQVWRDEDNVDVLDQLTDDLSGVASAATEASLPAVAELAAALDRFYQRARAADAHPEESLVGFATEAHEELLNMMDYLAAGQDLPSQDTTIAQLNEWNFPEPAARDEVGEDSADDQWLTEEPSPVDPAEIDEQEDDMILDIFLEEAEEISEAIEGIMQVWQDNPDDLLPVAQLQRELHTLKGGARMAELPEVADLTHELETLYERLNDGVIERTPETLPLIQRAHDALANQLQAVRAGQVPENNSALIAEIHHMAAGAAPVADEPPATPSEVDVRSESADESDREIVGIFLEEAGELMDALDEAVEGWKGDNDNRNHPDEILRVLHTLKGGARLAGLSRIGDTAHQFETDVQKAVDRGARFDQTFFGHLHERQETIQEQLDQVARLLEDDGVLVLGEKELLLESTATDSEHDVDGAVDETDEPDSAAVDGNDPLIEDVNVDEDAESDELPLAPVVIEAESALPATDIQSQNSKAVQQSNMAAQRKAPTELVKVSADLLDGLVNLAGETAIGRGRLEQQVSDFSHTLGEMDQTLDRLRDQLRRLDIETEAQVLFRQERHGPDYDDFDPLEMDRYSAIQQLSRALMESASDMLDLKETLSLKTRDAETLLLQQSRVNTELQEGLMKTRMVPFQRLVPRLRRIVRQVSLELDKQVELRVNNADGEMDRTILERIISPLEHMVRNAVDHGIEQASKRQDAGKPASGNIELDIRRDGGDVVLTMRDDGRGIDIDAVLKKARNRGMIPADVTPSDAEIIQCIMQPGFSTAEVITQISGRGVGMDVVNSEIKQMGGSLEVRSQAGQGTEFEIRLPFTVSVNRALMVRVGDDLYAVPLNNIQGIVRASVSELQALYDRPEDERLFAYAGREYQLGYLGAMLDSGSHPKIAGHQLPLPLLLIRGQVPFALQVDSLLGSREIVVKSLGPQFAGVRGISGGTILGDGSVVIILDLPAMIRTQTSLEYQQARALEDKAAEARHEHDHHLPTVLVVDDSVTVRKVTGRLLERHGMEVLTAKDGVHAMEVLQDHKPDVILLDIEMPRMDGFEVASLVRHDERLKDVPIIMITSRTGEKHRERAMSIGVNDYLGKPFQEDTLLERINGFLEQGVH